MTEYIQYIGFWMTSTTCQMAKLPMHSWVENVAM